MTDKVLLTGVSGRIAKHTAIELFSYLDSSAKTMIPDLEITMQTDTSYAEDLLGLKFNPAKDCISETAKSVVRLGLV